MSRSAQKQGRNHTSDAPPAESGTFRAAEPASPALDEVIEEQERRRARERRRQAARTDRRLLGEAPREGSFRQESSAGTVAPNYRVVPEVGVCPNDLNLTLYLTLKALGVNTKANQGLPTDGTILGGAVMSELFTLDLVIGNLTNARPSTLRLRTFVNAWRSWRSARTRSPSATRRRARRSSTARHEAVSREPHERLRPRGLRGARAPGRSGCRA